MTISAATLAKLVAAGLSGEELVDVVRSIEADGERASKTSGAERQRRYRERKSSRGDVTGDVTRDVTDDASLGDGDPLPLPPSPQTPQPPTPAPGDVTTREGDDADDRGLKAKRSAPRRPLPEDWTPAEKGRRGAIDRGMPPEMIDREVERFRDFHRAKGNLFASFDAAWLTWCGNFANFNPPRLIHDRNRPHHPDRKQAAHAERLQDIGAAMQAAARGGGS